MMTDDFINHGLMVERVVGSVIYRMVADNPEFLLIRFKNTLRFPQRRIWPGESISSAALRAAKETISEDHLQLIEPARFKCICQFPGWDPLFKRKTTHSAVFLLIKASDPVVSALVEDFCWVSYREAVHYLIDTPLQEILQQAFQKIKLIEEVGCGSISHK